MQKNTVFLGLGTNQGDKMAHLNHAMCEINEQIGEIIHISSVYESEPWGFESEHTFLNMVIECTTELTPFELINSTEKIEQLIGKNKTIDGKYSDRNIDIDILFYSDLKINTDKLAIPHPFIWERNFVYLPLLEIDPEKINLKPNNMTLENSLSYFDFKKKHKF